MFYYTCISPVNRTILYKVPSTTMINNIPCFFVQATFINIIPSTINIDYIS